MSDRETANSGGGTRTARIVALISGNGSNLQAIIDACACGELPAEVALVVSNRRDAYGMVRAYQAAIPALYFPLKPYLGGRGRARYDEDLATQVAAYRPDVVAMAGWMHVLSNSFLQRFPGKVINLHPALPGAFPGTDAIARAYAAHRAGRIAHTGVMIHFVPDEGVDIGPVITSEIVPILPDDTLHSLEERIHATEHRLYVQALTTVLATL